MSNAAVSAIAWGHHRAHELTLGLVAGPSEEQMTHQPNRSTPCVAFHIWHMARYTDSLGVQIGAAAGAIWHTDKLAERWGLDTEILGMYENGTEMHEGVSATLRWPAKDILLDYARRAFDAAEQVVGSLGEDQLERPPKWGRETVDEELMSMMLHTSRHLGMIECMRGVLGLRGSATQ